jgi:diacylglycerol O-acyltransferase-1
MSDVRNSLTYLPHTRVSISLFSSEAESPNYRGFLNLGAIVVIVANLRLIIENIMKYGLLLQIPSPSEFLIDYRKWPCLSMLIFLLVPIYLTYFIEAVLALRIKNNFLIWLLHVINISAVLTLPVVVMSMTHSEIFTGTLLLLFTCTAAMKLWSFAHVMGDVRAIHAEGKLERYPKEISEVVRKYPSILSLKHFSYFIAVPTLCFQFSYPRTERIRKTWLLKRMVEWLLSQSLMLVLIHQYGVPLVKNTLPYLLNDPINYIGLLERHLKLALPNLYVWLLMFFGCFQCWCNILAELFRFGDRTFYKEWWNARTFREYWSTWNIPVHSWLSRHVYNPLVSRGLPKPFSMFCVFTVSAIGHEYIVSGACHMLSYYAFLAMMFQIPLIIVTDIFKKFLEKSQLGNVIFWLSFCIVGQPLAVIVYSYLVISQGKV